jgi:thioredoxin-related protein
MVKKLILLAFLVCSVFAAQIEWAANYKAAIEKAKKENKSVLLMLSKPECPYCEQMKDVVFKKDELLINEINANFVAVDVNILKDDWNKKFRAYATPTFYFLDKNENKLARQSVGATSGAEFLKILKDIQKQR